MSNKTCCICCGTMEGNKCRACGWVDRATFGAWMLVHMSLLLLVIVQLKGSLV